VLDIGIIGGGVGGLVTASGSAQFGAKVALVEKGKLGGDCLNFGCVPTKSLLHSAKIFRDSIKAEKLGLHIGNTKLDFGRVMERMREVQSTIAVHDDPERFRKMGVDVIFGTGLFEDRHTFAVPGRKIKAKKFLIATGSRPAESTIPGSDGVSFLNNENILDIKTLPESMIILGAGPIGIEYAQIFSRFGCKVTLFQRRGRILPKEDHELAKMLEGILRAEGVDIQTAPHYDKVEESGGKVSLTVSYGEGKGQKVFSAEKILVATGRKPNIEGLNLEGIGVKSTDLGIVVDDTLKTTVSNIWACGDVIGLFPFTHAAEHQAGVVISNALFPLVRRKINRRVVPWCTFTDPEFGRVGLTEVEAKSMLGASNVSVYRFNYSGHDRAVIEGATEGMVKVVCDLKGKILGAHILGANGGDLINEYALAMNSGLGVQQISQTIHVYPSMGQVVKRGADQYYREKLFSGPFALFTKFWFGKK